MPGPTVHHAQAVNRPTGSKPRKRVLTLDEHRALAAELKRQRETYLQIGKWLYDRGIPKSHRIHRDIIRALKNLEQLGCHMDSQVFEDCPEEETKTLADVYYGPES